MPTPENHVYANRVRALESEGMTTSDAQAVIGAEDERAEPLEHNDGSDYTLRPDHISAWITVDLFSVYVHRTDDGVVVDIYPLHDEAGNAVAACYAFSHELPDANDD